MRVPRAPPPSHGPPGTCPAVTSRPLLWAGPPARPGSGEHPGAASVERARDERRRVRRRGHSYSRSSLLRLTRSPSGPGTPAQRAKHNCPNGNGPSPDRGPRRRARVSTCRVTGGTSRDAFRCRRTRSRRASVVGQRADLRRRAGTGQVDMLPEQAQVRVTYRSEPSVTSPIRSFAKWTRTRRLSFGNGRSGTGEGHQVRPLSQVRTRTGHRPATHGA
jgi:hypothetical protein